MTVDLQTDWREVMTVAEPDTRVRYAWEVSVAPAFTGPISLNLAPREVMVSVVDAQPGDRVQVYRSAAPTVNGTVFAGGIMVEAHATVFEAGRVPLALIIPAVAVNQTLTIPLRLIAYRPPA